VTEEGRIVISSFVSFSSPSCSSLIPPSSVALKRDVLIQTYKPATTMTFARTNNPTLKFLLNLIVSKPSPIGSSLDRISLVTSKNRCRIVGASRSEVREDEQRVAAGDEEGEGGRVEQSWTID